MTGRPLPPSASVTLPGSGVRLVAPSADRNRGYIASLLQHVAPERGDALELASGTGQHVVTFAEALPQFTWQPSEIDPARRASIAAYVADAGLPNLRPPVEINATAPGWGAAHRADLIVVVNLLHLIRVDEVKVLLKEAARALRSGGRFVLYGPFMRAGELTSPGDQSFHADLIAADPAIGYKDDFDTLDWLIEAGLDIAEVVEMPANNLGIVARAW